MLYKIFWRNNGFLCYDQNTRSDFARFKHMLSTPFFVDNVDNSVYNLFLGMFSVVNYVDNLWTGCL